MALFVCTLCIGQCNIQIFLHKDQWVKGTISTFIQDALGSYPVIEKLLSLGEVLYANCLVLWRGLKTRAAEVPVA